MSSSSSNTHKINTVLSDLYKAIGNISLLEARVISLLYSSPNFKRSFTDIQTELDLTRYQCSRLVNKLSGSIIFSTKEAPLIKKQHGSNNKNKIAQLTMPTVELIDKLSSTSSDPEPIANQLNTNFYFPEAVFSSLEADHNVTSYVSFRLDRATEKVEQLWFKDGNPCYKESHLSIDDVLGGRSEVIQHCGNRTSIMATTYPKTSLVKINDRYIGLYRYVDDDTNLIYLTYISYSANTRPITSYPDQVIVGGMLIWDMYQNEHRDGHVILVPKPTKESEKVDVPLKNSSVSMFLLNTDLEVKEEHSTIGAALDHLISISSNTELSTSRNIYRITIDSLDSLDSRFIKRLADHSYGCSQVEPLRHHRYFFFNNWKGDRYLLTRNFVEGEIVLVKYFKEGNSYEPSQTFEALYLALESHPQLLPHFDYLNNRFDAQKTRSYLASLSKAQLNSIRTVLFHNNEDEDEADADDLNSSIKEAILNNSPVIAESLIGVVSLSKGNLSEAEKKSLKQSLENWLQVQTINFNINDYLYSKEAR